VARLNPDTVIKGFLVLFVFAFFVTLFTLFINLEMLEQTEFDLRVCERKYKEKNESNQKNYDKRVQCAEELDAVIDRNIQLLNDQSSCHAQVFACKELVNDIQENNLRKIGKDNNARGMYYPDTGLIEIYSTRIADEIEFVEVAFHEYGHKVWFQDMSQTERRAVMKEYDTDPDFITKYSKKNAEEYFAEHYWWGMRCEK
jgi:hypothetical protein